MKIILPLLLFIPLLGFSQAWQFQAPAGRPLRQVIREFRDQFGWLITFEDVPDEGSNARLADTPITNSMQPTGSGGSKILRQTPSR